MYLRVSCTKKCRAAKTQSISALALKKAAIPTAAVIQTSLIHSHGSRHFSASSRFPANHRKLRQGTLTQSSEKAVSLGQRHLLIVHKLHDHGAPQHTRSHYVRSRVRLRIEPTKHAPPPSRASQASSAPAGFGHRGPAHRNYLPSLRKRCKLVPGSAKLAELLVKVIVQTFLGSQRLLSLAS